MASPPRIATATTNQPPQWPALGLPQHFSFTAAKWWGLEGQTYKQNEPPSNDRIAESARGLSRRPVAPAHCQRPVPQTQLALGLCGGRPEARRRAHLQGGCGLNLSYTTAGCFWLDDTAQDWWRGIRTHKGKREVISGEVGLPKHDHSSSSPVGGDLTVMIIMIIIVVRMMMIILMFMFMMFMMIMMMMIIVIISVKMMMVMVLMVRMMIMILMVMVLMVRMLMVKMVMVVVMMVNIVIIMIVKMRMMMSWWWGWWWSRWSRWWWW